MELGNLYDFAGDNNRHKIIAKKVSAKPRNSTATRSYPYEWLAGKVNFLEICGVDKSIRHSFLEQVVNNATNLPSHIQQVISKDP